MNARVTAVETFLNIKNSTCTYLPDYNITITNLLGDPMVSVNQSYSICNEACSLAMTHDNITLIDPVYGTLITDGANAHVDLSLSAVPTLTLPYAKPFEFGYISPTSESPMQTVWVFILGQVPGSADESQTISTTNVSPISVIWHPPGDLSYAKYESVHTTVMTISWNYEMYATTGENDVVGLGAFFLFWILSN